MFAEPLGSGEGMGAEVLKGVERVVALEVLCHDEALELEDCWWLMKTGRLWVCEFVDMASVCCFGSRGSQ